MTASRENWLNSHTSFRDHDLHEKFEREKTSRGETCFSEKENTYPKRAFLEGEETGRKCSECVQKEETERK